ncbi:MAG: hypothetical protein MZW92_43140 [Comamonadaceae bacterium]|nr:hypothetical protein [Comamonadaceae bacterium]
MIGSRANIRALHARRRWSAFVQQQYTGANVVVGVAGNVDPDAVVAAAGARRSATCRGGSANRVAAAATTWAASACGGCPASSQAHVVLGFPVPGLLGEYHAAASRRRCSAKA